MTEQEIERVVKDKIATEVAKVKRKWALIVAAVAAVIPLTLWATSITKPHTFADGDTLSAAKLNENFDTLYARVNELSSRLGKYCGETASTFDGLAVGGATGAKAKCVTACGNSNAHMCTVHELSIEFQKGTTIPGNLWYSSYLETRDGGAVWNDCNGWTANTTSVLAGPVTSNTTPGRPEYTQCDSLRKIACCL